MKERLLAVSLVLTTLLATAGKPAGIIHVACIGDSITYGATLQDRETQSYPSQLQHLLGDGYVVRNFGKNGTTLLRRGHRPYIEQDVFAEAMEYPADIIVIHLGVNDTDPRDWPNYRDDFVGDYLTMIDTLKTVSPDARVLLALTTPITDRHPRFQSGTKEWQDEIQDAIRTVADISGADLIDFHTPLYSYPQHIPDAVHPDVFGASLLAKTVCEAITGDYGGLQLSPLYTDHMVLQQNVPLDIHGIADAGSKIRVKLGGKCRQATADVRGRWRVVFPAQEAAEGLTLSISSKGRKIVLKDVAIGEVWLCSGQSNMEFKMHEASDTEADIAASYDPGLRLYDMKSRWRTDNVAWPAEALDSLNNLDYFKKTVWIPATSASVIDFSAVAYYFGRMLRKELGVPIGLICNAVGGSTTESWIGRQTLETCFPKILENWTANDFIQEWARERALKNISNRRDNTDRHPYQPCYLFEAGILPLDKYTIRGSIWYQGESNAHNKSAHSRLFSLLVDCWRGWWGNPDMPIYYVQLSSIERPSWPWFRDSQRLLLGARPRLGMVVTSDLGDPYDVHYKKKRPVGERLARWALYYDYGRSDVVPSGPLPCLASTEDVSITVTFDWGDGLHAGVPGTGAVVNGPITGFEIAGSDGLFKSAKAEIEGNSIVLSAEGVKRPVMVRYAWEPYTRANLYNGVDLPASTFRICIADSAE